MVHGHDGVYGPWFQNLHRVQMFKWAFRDQVSDTGSGESLVYDDPQVFLKKFSKYRVYGL